MKPAVLEYWNKKLRGQASLLHSLKYFNPNYMSLTTTHPIFSTCGTSSYEISKAVVQARYLSGRARVESLTKHWDNSNKEGLCLLCKDTNSVPGSEEHLLLPGGCPALAEARLSMTNFFNCYLVSRPYLFPILKTCWNCDSDFLSIQFLLDPSVVPAVIESCQESTEPILSDVFYLTRTYVFKLYLTRKKLLGNI